MPAVGSPYLVMIRWGMQIILEIPTIWPRLSPLPAGTPLALHWNPSPSKPTVNAA